MPHMRWIIAALLTLVTAVNILDRQALSVTAGTKAPGSSQTILQKDLGIDNDAYGRILAVFLIAYGILHPVMGRVIDWLGTRTGLALALAWWSVANMAHAFAGGVMSFMILRFLLGVGEAGNFPAAIKSVGEWFPAKERTIATGMINAGTAVGGLFAPPLVGAIIYYWGWRAAFFVTGASGLLCLIPWLILARRPNEADTAAAEAGSAATAPMEGPATKGFAAWGEALSQPALWVLMVARLLTDPVWLFLAFWIPKYFQAERGFDLKQIALYTGLPFVLSGFGSLAGGWLSADLVRRGYSVLTARKLAISISAAMMPIAILAVYASSWKVAMACVSVMMFAHQSWAASILTLPADLFPKRMTGLCYGLPAMLGIFGGAATQYWLGPVVTHYGYTGIFIIAGLLHPIAAVIAIVGIKSLASEARPELVEAAAR
jgi:MFS transporter, ACS family, hexuronate transporter